MTFTLFSVAVIFILAVNVFFGIYRGARRGFLKELVNVASLVTSLIISLLLTPIISQLISAAIMQVLKVMPFYISLFPNSIYMDFLITGIAAIIISSVLFLVVMAVAKRLLGIVFKIISRSKEKNKAKEMFPSEDAPAYEKRPKVWGGAAGAVAGLLVTIIIMAPITGTLRMVSGAIGIVDSIDKNFFALPEARREVDNLNKYANDGISIMLYHIGGEIIYSSAASTMMNGETIYAANEMEAVGNIIGDLMALLPAIQNIEGGADQAAAIDELCRHMQDSKLIDYIMAEFLPQIAGAWMQGSDYMMMPKPMLNEMVAPAFDAILQICASSNVYNVKDNAVSLLRIYSIILSSGILQAGTDINAIIACVEQSGLIAKINAEIDKNPNMSIIKTYTAEIAVRAIADNIYGNFGDLGNLGDIMASPEYADLTQRLADAIETINNKGYGTDEEKINAMTDYAKEYLSDYGVEIPEGVAEPIAEIMLSKIGSGQEISAADIESFFKSYLSGN